MTANQQASPSGGAGRHRAQRPVSRVARWGRRLFVSVDRALCALEIRTFPHHLNHIDSERVGSVQDDNPDCRTCERLQHELDDAEAQKDHELADDVRIRQHDHQMESHVA